LISFSPAEIFSRRFVLTYNQSTFNLIRKTLVKTRLGILRSKTKAFCQDCKSVQRVLDKFPNGEIGLACGHRRPLVEERVIAEYEQEKQRRSGRKKVSRTNSASQRLEVTYEEIA
jgi:hypothetical protein